MIYNTINNKTIDVNLWILKNVYRIRLWIKILLTTGIFIISYLLITNVSDFIESNKQVHKLYENIVFNKNFVSIDNSLKSIAPESLVLKNFGVAPGYSDKYYDFFALVENNNKNYVIDSIEYYFKYANNKTVVQKDRLTIDSEKFLFLTGVNADTEITEDPEFIVKSLNWKLINKKTEKPISRYTDTKVPKNCLFFNNELSVEDIKVTRNVQAVTNREVGVLSFSIKNSSLYNYRSINNKIIFYNKDNKVIGVFQKELYLLNSGESKSMSINLSPNIVDLNSVLVIPEIDVCQEESFI